MSTSHRTREELEHLSVADLKEIARNMGTIVSDPRLSLRQQKERLIEAILQDQE